MSADDRYKDRKAVLRLLHAAALQAHARRQTQVDGGRAGSSSGVQDFQNDLEAVSEKRVSGTFNQSAQEPIPGLCKVAEISVGCFNKLK